MRRSWVDASRIGEVRRAARSWRDAGRIDAATLTAIQAEYPQQRHALAPAWKVLIFGLVSVAIQGVFFGIFQFRNAESAMYWVLAGVLLAVASEGLRSSKFAGNGSDAAASFWAIVYLLVGVGLLLSQRPGHDDEVMITLLLLLAAVAFAAACAHWGHEAYGAFATIALFGLLGRFPGGRILWILTAAILMAASSALLDRVTFAPDHRRALAGVFVVAAAAFYTAINLYALDHRFIEVFRTFRAEHAQGPAIRTLAALATAIFPVALVFWGLRTRRMLILNLGVVLAAVSLVTLRHYVHLAPLWVVLVVAGAALIVGALWLNRRLRLAPDGERAGFTAAALSSSGKTGNLAVAAVVAGMAPGAQPEPARQGDFSGGGGRFGGGGASGEF